MDCEYFVYYPATKHTELHTYTAVIPLKDFYNRKLRDVKSCIVSDSTKETSLVIDNYEVVKYCIWEEALEYFNNNHDIHKNENAPRDAQRIFKKPENSKALKNTGQFLFKAFISAIVVIIVVVLTLGIYSIHDVYDMDGTANIQVPDPVSSTNPNNFSDYVTTGYYTQTYTWAYKGYQQSHTFSFPDSLYAYYRNEPHTWLDYSSYAVTEHDRQMLKSVISVFEEEGERRHFTRDENALNVIAFVQSMPYKYDDETTGYDEYPRYPVETLVDRGGDCEDSAILAAALLFEMGYDVVLLEFSTHAAIGLASSGSLFGDSYLYNGTQYYYVETTETGWRAGEVPTEYKSQQPEIYPIEPAPSLTIHLTPSYHRRDSTYVYYKVEYTIINDSPTAARNVTFQIYTHAEPFDENWIWDEYLINIEMLQGGETVHSEAILKATRRENTYISCIAYGDNLYPVRAMTNTISVR